MPVKTKSDKAVGERTFEHNIEIVGVGFRVKRDARDALARLADKRPIDVTLVREQENKYDLNAIKVIHSAGGALSGKHIGYVRKEAAAILAPKMDEQELVFKSAELLSLYANDDNKTGMLHVVFTDNRKR